jgi:hypothetical protein
MADSLRVPSSIAMNIGNYQHHAAASKHFYATQDTIERRRMCSEACTYSSCSNFLNDLPAIFWCGGVRASLCFVKYLRSLRGPPLPNAVNSLSLKFRDALRCHLMEEPFRDPWAVSTSFGFSRGVGGELEGFGERWKEAETEEEKDALRKALFRGGLERDDGSWEQDDSRFSYWWTY